MCVSPASRNHCHVCGMLKSSLRVRYMMCSLLCCSSESMQGLHRITLLGGLVAPLTCSMRSCFCQACHLLRAKLEHIENPGLGHQVSFASKFGHFSLQLNGADDRHIEFVCCAGLRVGSSSSSIEAQGAPVLRSLDHVLLDKDKVWQHVQPDTVLQLGGHMTSKRISSFLEWCSLSLPNRCAARGHVIMA